MLIPRDEREQQALRHCLAQTVHADRVQLACELDGDDVAGRVRKVGRQRRERRKRSRRSEPELVVGLVLQRRTVRRERDGGNAECAGAVIGFAAKTGNGRTAAGIASGVGACDGR